MQFNILELITNLKLSNLLCSFSLLQISCSGEKLSNTFGKTLVFKYLMNGFFTTNL